jgi:hypothetical protein
MLSRANIQFQAKPPFSVKNPTTSSVTKQHDQHLEHHVHFSNLYNCISNNPAGGTGHTASTRTTGSCGESHAQTDPAHSINSASSASASSSSSLLLSNLALILSDFFCKVGFGYTWASHRVQKVRYQDTERYHDKRGAYLDITQPNDLVTPCNRTLGGSSSRLGNMVPDRFTRERVRAFRTVGAAAAARRENRGTLVGFPRSGNGIHRREPAEWDIPRNSVLERK